jgi:Leucine rich repeat
LNFLEELEIIGNSDHNLNWKNLPPAIESIFSLKKLVIRNVGLEKIPKQVGSLSKLEELDVSSNNLTSFPVSILSYLTRLEKLIIADNKLPDEIITQIHEVPLKFWTHPLPLNEVWTCRFLSAQLLFLLFLKAHPH